MSLDVALTTRPTLRPAIENSIPGKTPKLYYEVAPTTATEPFALMRSPEIVPQETMMHEYLMTIYLDVWTLGPGDMARIQDAIQYLNYFNPPDYGNAIGAKFRLASSTLIPESEQRLHLTNLYAVRFFDRRNLPVS